MTWYYATHMKDMLQALVFGGLFLVLFLPLYVESDFFFPFITGKNFAFRIIVEIVFASWILLALFDVKYRPKFSWILAAFAGLLVIMAVANALGEYPLRSFWSNFERMDGYITLVHVFLYTLVLGSVITTHKAWSYFLNTSVAVALMVAIYGLAQYSGMVEGTEGSRVDSRLGNAAYMAVYMLFHLFFIAFLAVRSKVKMHQVLYALVGLIFVYTLLLTGTRGTFLGFVGGSIVAVGYITLFGRRVPELRKYTAGVLVVLAIVGLSFMAVRDTDVIQNNGSLARIANIDLKSDLVVRGTIWNMAWQGVKERPLLGYGQGNFNYVFNAKYDPSLYDQEPWFDRVHNIFFDWLIAGGILGFIAYFSIMLAVIYYLFIVPVLLKKESPFTVLEQAVLVGLLVGYLMHNLVVFDNIISYIFYGTMLALIHSRIATPIKAIESYKIEPVLITQFAMPVVILVTGFGVYMLNAPGIQTAKDLIDALVAQTYQERLDGFDSALGRNSFARQEVVEQLSQKTISDVHNQNISQQERIDMQQRTELELLSLIDSKPGDARIHNFLTRFYRTIGAIPQSREQAAIATSLSPRKPSLILEQAILELQENKLEEGLVFLKKAFELEEKNTPVRVLYAAVLMRSGQVEEAKELISEEYLLAFADSEYALSATKEAEDFEFLAKLLVAKIEKEPKNAQHRASLSFVYYKLGDIEKSVEVLTQAGEDIEVFAPTAQCYVANLEAGNAPDKGCN